MAHWRSISRSGELLVDDAAVGASQLSGLGRSRNSGRSVLSGIREYRGGSLRRLMLMWPTGESHPMVMAVMQSAVPKAVPISPIRCRRWRPVAERLCVHARSGVKRSTHAATDIPIPGTGTRPGGVDPCRTPQASVSLLSPRDTKGARAAAITHVYRFPPLGQCRHLFDKRIGHKLDGVRPVVRHRRVGEGTPARPVRHRRAAASLG